MYQILHARRISTEVGLLNVAKHNSREDIYNEDLAFKNSENPPSWLKNTLSDAEKRLQSNGKKASDVLSLRKEKMQNLARKPQKNASAAIEFVVSASPEWQGDWKEYFEKSREFLVRKYGDNIISCAVHADETTPHMHVIFVPIIEKDGKRRYSSSNFLGKRDDLKKLHSEFYEEVGKFFELERGEENARPSYEEASSFSGKIKALEKKEIALQEKENIVKEAAKEVNEKEKKADEQIAIFEDFNKSVEDFLKEHAKPETVLPPKYRDKIIPDFENDYWKNFNTDEGIKKSVKKNVLEDWKMTVKNGCKMVVEKCQTAVRTFQREFEKCYNQLQTVSKALYWEMSNHAVTRQELKETKEKLKKTEERLSLWRSKTPQELRELADRRESRQQQQRTRSSGFER